MFVLLFDSIIPTKSKFTFKMKFRPVSLFATMLVLFNMLACSEDDVQDALEQEITNSLEGTPYAGAASFGDIVTAEVDNDSKRYYIFNETTEEVDSGTYDVQAAEATNGLYIIESGENDLDFGIELGGVLFGATTPAGNNQNQVSFMLSNSENVDLQEDRVADNYVYVRIGGGPVNGSADFLEYGYLSLNGDGSAQRISLATGGQGDTYVDTIGFVEDKMVFPLSSFQDTIDTYSSLSGLSIENGSWSISNDKNNSVTFTDAEGNNQEAFAYADDRGGVFIVDLGEGNGMYMGLRIDELPANYADNIFKFIGVNKNAGKAAGAFQVLSDNSLEAYVLTGEGEETGPEFVSPLTVVNEETLPNVLRSEDGITFVVVGETFMYFEVDDNGVFTGYGAGATI